MSEIGRTVTRPTQSELSVSQKPVSSPKMQENFPALWLFLSKQRDLGESHKTGSMTIFADGPKLKCVLNDRPCRTSCFVSADGLVELFARADRGLEEGSHNWSAANYRRRSRAKVNV